MVKALLRERDFQGNFKNKEVYLHGNGQVYLNKEASDFRKKFGMPDSYEDYVLTFSRESVIPDNLDDLKNLFLNTKSKENYMNAQPVFERQFDSLNLLDFEEEEKEAEKPKQIIKNKR